MILSFHPCFVADHQIILGHRGLNSDDLSLISDAEVILLPQSCSYELYQACAKSSALLFPDYKARFEYPGKIGQSRLFKKIRSPHPETLEWRSVREFRKACRDSWPHEVPFLLKADKTHEADGVYLIEDSKTLESALRALMIMEGSGSTAFISQEMIPTHGNVLRAVIIGQETITYWKRPENRGKIITTAGKGARIDSVWRADLQEEGKIQAQKLRAFTGINLAAVDLVFPFTKAEPKPMFLEINYYFGRRGLGGSLKYYGLLFKTIRKWLETEGFDPRSIGMV